MNRGPSLTIHDENLSVLNKLALFAHFFDGFFRRAVSNFENGVVTGVAELQLQQAMLTPFLMATFEVSQGGRVVATQTQNIEHAEVGLLRLTPDIAVADLDPQLTHQVTVSVTDAATAEPVLVGVLMPQ